MNTDPVNSSPDPVELREVRVGDVALFFEHQLDLEATRMAAFGAAEPRDRQAFAARWERLLADVDVDARTVTVNGRVAGYVAEFGRDGLREVTYWLAREFWGRGVATAALARFLARPGRLHADEPTWGRAAADNAGSIRVLQKCGFELAEKRRAFASARGAEIDEVVLQRRADPDRD